MTQQVEPNIFQDFQDLAKRETLGFALHRFYKQ
jgi:hypothetical protein